MHYRPGVEAVPGYRLQKMLGRGGFGEVWQAEGPGRVNAAVKIIDKVDEKAGRKEFRALKLIKDLKHPNLVSIIGFWLKDAEGKLLDPEVYIDETRSTETRPSELIVAMDLCEKSLLDRLNECRKGLADDTLGGIPVDELLEYAEAAAKAIDYLNTRHQIQHRDIKPHNIMIVGGSAQVCDFGLASTISSARTSMGGAGSLAYMAPEVYSTKRASTATDQYSLAITYCELRTGRLPLSDVESFAVLDDAKRKGILDLTGIDDSERPVITKATSSDPAMRYPSCLEFVQAMRRAVSGGISGTSSRPAEPIAGYQLERSLRSRDGEDIWDAVDPDGLRVTLVVRDLQEAPASATRATMALVRDLSRNHPRLAEVYEFASLSSTDKVLPARLFEGPNSPIPAKLIVAGRRAPRNLSERLSSGGLPINRLLAAMNELAEAIDFLNTPQHNLAGRKVGVQHANIRPVNLIVEDDHVLLGNFASAQTLNSDEDPFPLGKEFEESAFAPPEFAAGKITRWSDQYMLGVAYLQLRTGKPSASLTRSTGVRVTSTSSRLDLVDLKPAERAAVERATSADPKQRFATCAEFVAELSKCFEGEPAEPPAPKPADKPSTSRGDANRTLFAPGITNISDSARTAVFDRPSEIAASAAPVAPPSGKAAAAPAQPRSIAATAVPSFADTMTRQDTDPSEAGEAADAATAAATQARAAQRPARPVRPAPAAGGASWQKPAIFGAIAVAILGGVFAFVRLRNGGTVDPTKEKTAATSDDPRVAEAIGKVQQQIKQNAFAEAQKTLTASADLLGAENVGNLQDELIRSWTARVSELRNSAEDKQDSKQMLTAATEAGQMAELFRDNEQVGTLTRGVVRSLLSIVRKKLAAAVGKSQAETMAAELATLLEQAPKWNLTEAGLLAEAKLLRGRALVRAGNNTKARTALADVQPADLADSRDKAAHAVLLGLTDAAAEKKDRDKYLASLDDLQSRFAAQLDPWERTTLATKIQALRGVGNKLLDDQAKALLEKLDGLIAGGKPTLAEALKTIADLPENVALSNHFSNSPWSARLKARQLLATLQSAGLPRDQYNAAIESLDERVRVDREADKAAPLAIAAVDRALAIESTLSYGKNDDVNAVRTLVRRARDLAKSAVELTMEPERAALEKHLASADARRIALAVERLHSLRDKADDPATFARLRAYAAGVADIVASSPAAKALCAACQSEADLIANKALPLADRQELRTAEQAAGSDDREYVAYVAALARGTSGDELAGTADRLQKAFANKTATATWGASPPRRTIVKDRLTAAALAQATGRFDDITSKFFSSPASAKKAADWLDLIFDWIAKDRDPLAIEQLRDLVYLRALATYHADPSDKKNAAAVTGWTDQLVDPQRKFDPPMQVVLVNALSHAQQGHAAAAITSLGRLYERSRMLLASTDAKAIRPTPEAIDEQILAPALALLSPYLAVEKLTAADALSPAAKQAAAKLLAARGRLAQLYPGVQARVQEELTAAKSKQAVAEAAYGWFDAATRLDDSRAEYFYGRGYANDLLANVSYAEKAKRMLADAAEALAPKRTPQEFPAAYGLRGLANHYAALAESDFAKKRTLLEAADNDYADALRRCEKLRTSANAKSYPDLDIDEPLFVIGRGNALLLQANYVLNPVDERRLLTEALHMALKVTDDRTDSDEPTKLDGVHPEWAYLLAGHALEDFGWILKEPEYYRKALVQFNKAEGAATRLVDPAGAALAKYNRGRCRYKLAADGYLATRGLLDAKDPAAPELTNLAAQALKTAESEISQFTASADRKAPELPESHAFLARMRLTYVESGLRSTDEFPACMSAFDAAVDASKEQGFSAADRQTFQLDQAASAMSFAIAARGRPSDAAARFKKAVDVCQSIVDSGDAPAVMKGRAKMLIAQVRSEQAARAGDYRDEILKSLGDAITLFDGAKSLDDARSAQAQRALYRAKLALAVNPRTATEDKLLADAADDLSAALPAGDALSADRLGRQRDFAIVLALQGAAAKVEHIQKLATAAKQIADSYDTQLHRNERVYMAAGFTQFSANAQPIFERDAAKQKTAIDHLALARKTVAKSEAAAREMTEKWRQAEPALP